MAVALAHRPLPPSQIDIFPTPALKAKQPHLAARRTFSSPGTRLGTDRRTSGLWGEQGGSSAQVPQRARAATLPTPDGAAAFLAMTAHGRSLSSLIPQVQVFA